VTCTPATSAERPAAFHDGTTTRRHDGMHFCLSENHDTVVFVVSSCRRDFCRQLVSAVQGLSLE
jgi:hypothetical protein